MNEQHCPTCTCKPPLLMFEVPSRKDFGRTLHVAHNRARNGEWTVTALCGRRLCVATIYGGYTHGYSQYDPARPGLCLTCRKLADR